MRGLSLVAASGGGHSSSRCAGLSLSQPFLLRSTGSRCAGSVVVAYRPSRSVACGIFPDQGLNLCPLHWQADSQPLRHQGSPAHFLIKSFFFLMLSSMNCLYTLDINPLLVISFANIFSHSVGCLFALSMVSFAVQKLLSLIRSYLFTQQFHSWVYIRKKLKHKFEKIHTLQCSQQHYLPLPKYGSNLSVHQQMNG